jgi:hypothetical protein
LGLPNLEQISTKASTVGFGSRFEARGPSWHTEEVLADALSTFDRKDARRVCVRKTCFFFHRSCKEAKRRISCIYEYELDAGISRFFSIEADNRDTFERIARVIGIYQHGADQSDFPIALLDQADNANSRK